MKISTIQHLEEFGRVQLSDHFFMREFLHSEVGNFFGIPNLPDYPELAIANGRQLCETLLEPLHDTFGKITIRSGYRSPKLNQFCNERKLGCGDNQKNAGFHIWDYPDRQGVQGAAACIVVHWYLEQYRATQDWRPLAWWIHDNLPYSRLVFFPSLCAFNISWRQKPERKIKSYVMPKGMLTTPGMGNFEGMHSDRYPGFPRLH